MKIVILSDGIYNPSAAAVISRLKHQGNETTLVVVKRKFTWANIRRIYFSYRPKQLFETAFYRYIMKKRTCSSKPGSVNKQDKFPVTLRKIIKDNFIPYIRVKDGQDPRLIKRLESLRPDILIYAGIGILRKDLLNMPRLGVLNAHMGLLPEYRGMNVLEWSLFNRHPVGVTIHFIDDGIDTGDIILRKMIRIEPGDTIDSLRHKSDYASIEALAQAVQVLKQGSFKPETQIKKQGRQYFVMHDKLKFIIEKRLASSGQ